MCVCVGGGGVGEREREDKKSCKLFRCFFSFFSSCDKKLLNLGFQCPCLFVNHGFV